MVTAQQQAVKARLAQLESQTKGLFSQSLDRTNTTQLQKALKAEQDKAVAYLKTQALTTVQKEQFNQQFGINIAAAAPVTTTKTISLVENLGIGLGGVAGSDGGVTAIYTPSGGATIQDDIMQQAIKNQVTETIRPKTLDELTQAERDEIAALDKQIADLQKQYDIPPPSFQRVGQLDKLGRPISDSGEAQTWERGHAELGARIDALKARRAAILSQTTADEVLKDKLGQAALDLADLIASNNNSADLKAAISQKMQEVNAILTEITSRNIKISQQALLDLGHVMDAGRYKLQEQTTAQSNVVEQLGKYLNTNLIQPVASAGYDLATGFQSVSAAFAAAFERLVVPTVADLEKRDVVMKEYQARQQAKFIEFVYNTQAGRKA